LLCSSLIAQLILSETNISNLWQETGSFGVKKDIFGPNIMHLTHSLNSSVDQEIIKSVTVAAAAAAAAATAPATPASKHSDDCTSL
jgi:hypothetical protein